MSNLKKDLNVGSAKRAEDVLLFQAKLLGHSEPQQELEYGMHGLLNNLLIDMLHLCGKDVVNEQLKEAIDHYTAELHEEQSGRTPAMDHHTLAKEPMLTNAKGSMMTLNQFKVASHLLRSDSLNDNRDRKHVILFGCNENGRWKYKITVYAKGGKHYAFQTAFSCLKEYVRGHFDPMFRFEFGQAYVADFNPNWNKGVPLSF
jgi:hypothetical protein